MKKLRSYLSILCLLVALFSFSAVGIVGFANESNGETVPCDDLAFSIDITEENKNVITSDNNPNGVTTQGITWKKLIENKSWQDGVKLKCYAHIGNVDNSKVAVVLDFVNPVSAKYFGKAELSFYPGGSGKIYAFNSKTTDFTPDTAKVDFVVQRQALNGFNFNTDDFKDDDGLVRQMTILIEKTELKADWFFGSFKFYLREEFLPVEEVKDFVLIATENEEDDPSPIIGAFKTKGENPNVNGVKSEYTMEQIQENNVYQQDTYGYSTLHNWTEPLTFTTIILKDPIDITEYESFTLTALFGAKGKFSLYPSVAKRFTRETATVQINTDEVKEYLLTTDAENLAKEDNKIYDFTFATENIVSSGQIFFKNIILKKADGSETIINFLDRNGIISSATENINKVDLRAYIFDFCSKQTYKEAGMGLCTTTMWKEANTALVIKFRRPISSENYDKMEFKIHSGLRGTLEIYPSQAKSFVTENAVLSQEIKQYEKNTFTLYLSDLADSDKMVRNFTILLPESLVLTKGDGCTAGQIFFGEASVKARTETSYLDEYVLTEGGTKSLSIEGNAEFITDNIPLPTGEIGAVDSSKGVKITGETTFNYKKKINQTETECGNIHLRMYLGENSPINKISFKKVGEEKPSFEFDHNGMSGWFEIILPVSDFLDEEGIISNMVITPDNEGEIIFGGAYVEDKLRILNAKTTTIDISEAVYMTENGITYKSTGIVDYDPLFENTQMSKNIVQFRMKISDFTDFNVMFNLAGKDKETDGIWFWFDETGLSMVGDYRCNYPSGVKAGEWFNVEIGAIPYTVTFMPYGVKAYIKINDQIMLEENIDNSLQQTGKWFSGYVHQTLENTEITVAPVKYKKTEILSLSLATQKDTIEVGQSERLIINRNIKLNGQEISAPTIVSGDSVTVDASGFITGVKAGVTVLKVTASQTGLVPLTEYTFTINVIHNHTVRIGNIRLTVKDGEKLVLPELTPPKDDLEFAGLYTDEECKNEFDYENTPVTDDMVLYAGWREAGGCGGSINSIPLVSVFAIGIAFIIIKVMRKREDK